MNRRSLILVAALGLTLAATWWASSLEEGAVSEPVAEARRGSAGGVRPAPRRALAGVPGTAGKRAPWPAEAATLMPVPRPPEPPEPAAPSAPPLPFRYVGLLEEGGVRTAILLEGADLHLVRARQRIDERYRVERITPTRIEFTYLPLDEPQVLETDDHGQEAE